VCLYSCLCVCIHVCVCEPETTLHDERVCYTHVMSSTERMKFAVNEQTRFRASCAYTRVMSSTEHRTNERHIHVRVQCRWGTHVS
jgi:hypothetical protein